jgi:ribonuclease R
MHRLGDRVEVKLVEAAPMAGALRFELLSEGKVLARKDRPKVAGRPGRPGLQGKSREQGGGKHRRGRR